ncbi:hypothetical protein O7634_22680 [Micromonospora sp. WMMD1120]|uniref:hypothetical protein n=1 Tax=Micromonospora sp. WMMD1120 TaxID=3016106 RepID=UPI002416E05A|nr:hypothetical protein [Micromonospora sp. WMMD1120]MDG4809564.1 hypothetical protein [Micromonospora sp. WMMD1120]
MRTPLQGGLPPRGAVVGPVVEIACDESGFSGTNLLRSSAPVITHASVDLSVDEAVAVITALRSGFRFAPHEVKSGQFLRRSGAAEALEWFRAALTGRAHVHLIDKEFFLVTRVVDLLLVEPSYAAGTRLADEHRPAALALHAAGRSAGADWTAFLAAFVDLVRMKHRLPAQQTVRRFFEARDVLRRHRLGRPADDVLDGLDPNRVRAVVARLDDDDRSIPPPLEPLLPALAETVLAWSDGRRQVLVTHDEQSALTADRLTRLRRTLASGPDATPVGALPSGVSPLAGLVMVDSRDDPRVQVADLLAGVARRLPEIIDDALRQPPPPVAGRDVRRSGLGRP